MDLADKPEDFFPPRGYGEDTRAVLAEVGGSAAGLVRDFGLCFQGEERSAWIRAGQPGGGPEVIRSYRIPGSGAWDAGVGALTPFPGLTRLALVPGSFLAALAQELGTEGPGKAAGAAETAGEEQAPAETLTGAS